MNSYLGQNPVNTDHQAALEKLFQALSFAADKHRDQRRKGVDAVPYINHPIEVAELLLRVGKIDDPDILAAAVLHDTLEDTETTPDELEQLFGAQVCRYVQEVSDDKTLPKAARKSLQIEHAGQLSKGAKLIKLADKIANINDIAANPPADWPVQRRLEYLDWAEQVVMGLQGVNSALGELFSCSLAQARQSVQQI